VASELASNDKLKLGDAKQNDSMQTSFLEESMSLADDPTVREID